MKTPPMTTCTQCGQYMPTTEAHVIDRIAATMCDPCHDEYVDDMLLRIRTAGLTDDQKEVVK